MSIRGSVLSFSSRGSIEMNYVLPTAFIVIVMLVSCGGGGKKADVEADQTKTFENQKALAVASSWRGNFPQALKEIEAAEKINDKDPEVYVIKGAIYMGLKEYPTAEQNYKKAVSLNPGYTPAHFNLCGLYLIQKNFDQVISECGLVTADPTYKARANAYTNIGIAYYNKGDMAKARENYEQALKLNPSFVYAHNEMGKLYMSTGRYGEAVTEFRQAVDGYPTYDEAYYNLGLAYLKLNDSVNACEAFRKVLDISPNSESGVNSNKYIHTVCN